ncbi:MAG: acyl-CoA synthetase [Solirubrobacteraceae bacterium]
MLFPALQDPAADRTALAFPERSLSYAELSRAARAIATQLDGVERVAVLAESRIETCVAVIGALLAGVPAIPINPKSGSSELAHIVADAEPAALALAPGAEAPDAFVGRRSVEIDLGEGGEGDAGAEPPERSDEDPALIVYTSGTTGRPKGAVLPRRAISSNLDALAQVWGWTEDDVVAHGLPLFHVHGLVIGILGPVRRGGTALHIGRFSPEGVREALDGPATMLFGVPTMYRRLAEAAADSPELARALGGARLLVSGSAALPASEHARLRELTGRGVVERYGMTETLMNTAIHADAEPAPGTVGPPLPGVDVRLVDDGGEVLETTDDETIGEIQVRGPNLFLEYLNRPDATAEAMRDGWFATGDMATRTTDGYIRIVGRRATDLIKSGGYKIGAGEIEGCLREHPAVEDAAVTGEADDDLGERVVAWVVLRDGASAESSELVDHVAGQLAPHKRPREVRFLDALPRNDMGKVQKARLSSP